MIGLSLAKTPSHGQEQERGESRSGLLPQTRWRGLDEDCSRTCRVRCLPDGLRADVPRHRHDHQSRYTASPCFTVGRQRHDHAAEVPIFAVAGTPSAGRMIFLHGERLRRVSGHPERNRGRSGGQSGQKDFYDLTIRELTTPLRRPPASLSEIPRATSLERLRTRLNTDATVSTKR